MDRTAGRLKRGETLVETIVSFAVIMIALAFVLVILRAAGGLNARSAQQLALLETSCSGVEADTGVLVSDAASVSFTVRFSDNASETIPVPLVLKEADPLHYFAVKGTTTP